MVPLDPLIKARPFVDILRERNNEERKEQIREREEERKRIKEKEEKQNLIV